MDQTVPAAMLTFLLMLLTALIAFGSEIEFQALFTRIPKMYINAFPLKVFENTTVEDCAQRCVREVEFECKSFDIDNRLRECHLHNHSHTEPLIGLQESLFMDHYRTGYEKLFNRIPNHIVTIKHQRNIRGLTVEECARRCLQELRFNCRGFDYETRRRNCYLTNKGLQDTNGLQKRSHTDFYERKSNGHLSRFTNYGYGSLQAVEGIQIHNKLVLGVKLEACAQLCLAETAFKCSSFDYVFGEQSCQMSQLIAANVHGMRTEFDTPYQVMHFELIEENLAYFYPTPFASVLGHNDKTYKKVTPDTCARKCLEERDFICRSFDYQVTEGTCLLSHVTGSDAGGLYTPNGVHVHHFELKPSLDCGDVLTSDRGSLASPNWPRYYSHHLNCTWYITVPRFKIVRFEIYHLDLGSQTEDPCDKGNDVLLFSEVINQKKSSHCAKNHLTEFLTQTNEIYITFTTNAEHDAQGFRVFYNADWPCSANLFQDNGEFASPRWPHRYPAMTSCRYIITGPSKSQIYLRFNTVHLENHVGSSCITAYDKINIYDGNSSASHLLETLCGTMPPTSFKSTTNILFIEFITDSRVQSEGFHASYKFIYHTTTSSTTTTSTTTGAYSSKSDMTHTSGGSELDVTSIFSVNNSNISISVNMALYDKREGTDRLDASFVEPTKLEENEGGESMTNNTLSDPGITGDDIGRGQPPTDKSSEIEAHEKTMRAIIWGVSASFLLIFVVVLATVLMVCQYHRRRLSKHREGTNMKYPEENMSLFGKTGSVCAQDLEEDVDDDARLPLPSSHEPPADVEFFNPLYTQRNRHQLSEQNEELSDIISEQTLDNNNLDITTEIHDCDGSRNQTSTVFALVTDGDIHSVTC